MPGLPCAAAGGLGCARRAALPRGALDHGCRGTGRELPRRGDRARERDDAARERRDRRRRRALPRAARLQARAPGHVLPRLRARAGRLRRVVYRHVRANPACPGQGGDLLGPGLPPGPARPPLHGPRFPGLVPDRRGAAQHHEPVSPGLLRQPGAEPRLRQPLGQRRRARRDGAPGPLRRGLAARVRSLRRARPRGRLRHLQRAVAGHDLAVVRQPGRLSARRLRPDAAHRVLESRDRGCPGGRSPPPRVLRAQPPVRRRCGDGPRQGRRPQCRDDVPQLLPRRGPGAAGGARSHRTLAATWGRRSCSRTPMPTARPPARRSS